MRTLTNEELMRAACIGHGDKFEASAWRGIIERLVDGRTVLAEPGEELSGVNTECPCCGEDFGVRPDGSTYY